VTHFRTLLMASAIVSAGLITQQAVAQQVVSKPTVQAVQPVPAEARVVQPTRSYRSYSVNPTRGDVRRNGPHRGEATWRHAGSKSVGHYGTGR